MRDPAPLAILLVTAVLLLVAFFGSRWLVQNECGPEPVVLAESALRERFPGRTVACGRFRCVEAPQCAVAGLGVWQCRGRSCAPVSP